jgi:hypothetical protein
MAKFRFLIAVNSANYLIDIHIPIKRWIRDKLTGFVFQKGEWNLRVEGSDEAELAYDFSEENSTLTTTITIPEAGNTPNDGISTSPRPRRQLVSSASSFGIVGINTMISLITGIIFFYDLTRCN